MATAPSPPILIWQPGGGVPVGPVSNPPVYSQKGITQLVAGQNYVDVVFSNIQTTTDWVLATCEVENTVDLAPLNIWPGIITSRTAVGFRLYLNGLPDSNNYYLHWAVTGVNIQPVPAPSYLLSGPSSGGIGVASTFSVSLPPSTTVSGPLTVTPNDGGGGGAFSPTSVVLTTTSASATFTYTPASYGAKTISVTNSGTLINPASLTFTAVAATYTLTGPSTGNVGVASTNFTMALPAGGIVLGTVTVTPSSGGGGGTFTPTTVALTTGAPSATFTYTPVSSGAKTISTTNNGGLTNPTGLTYTVAAFDPSAITGLKLWLKADAIAGPPADGTLISAWNDSSSTGYNLTNAGGSERPTFKTAIVNSQPVLRFDGVLNRLYNSVVEGVSQPYTIFVVANSTTLNDCRFLQSTGSATMLMGLDSVGGYIEIYAGAGGGFLKASSPVDQHGAFHCWSAIFSSTSSYIYSDGALVVTGDAGTNGIQLVGIMTDGTTNTVHSKGDVAEILVYNSALGTTDRVNVENYLRTKYNL